MFQQPVEPLQDSIEESSMFIVVAIVAIIASVTVMATVVISIIRVAVVAVAVVVVTPARLAIRFAVARRKSGTVRLVIRIGVVGMAAQVRYFAAIAVGPELLPSR
jgi:hypothetical protein